MCSDVEGTCEVSNLAIKFTKDKVLSFESVTDLVVSNTTIRCERADGDFCDVSVTLKSENSQIKFVNGSLLHSRAIKIISPTSKLLVDQTSVLDTSGTSTNFRGTSS